MELPSTKPYLLRAIWEWCCDNGFTPYIAVQVDERTRVPRDRPQLPTISTVFPGANWHERETHDFFGIRFEGHPDLSPLLLPEDATYHPLRKDFASAT